MVGLHCRRAAKQSEEGSEGALRMHTSQALKSVAFSGDAHELLESCWITASSASPMMGTKSGTRSNGDAR